MIWSESPMKCITSSMAGSFFLERKICCLIAGKKSILKRILSHEEMLEGLRNIERNMFGVSGVTDHFQEFKKAYDTAIRAGDIRVENIRLDDILISLLEK
jgi:hypothetical protein